MPEKTLLTILAFVLGSVLGSFYNVCIYRIPRGRSLINPPSNCNTCQKRLKAIDLIPIFSWLCLRGRCRQCKAKISGRYALVESLTGLLFAIAFFLEGLTFTTLFNLALISILIIISFIDIDTGDIYNIFIYPGILLAVIKFFVDGDYSVWKDKLLGGLIGAGVLLLIDLAGRLIFKKSGMGFGDVLLMLMAGLYLGAVNTGLSLLLAVWLGALGGLLLIKSSKDRKIDYMPFAPFLSAGILISVFWGNMLTSWYLGLWQ